MAEFTVVTDSHTARQTDSQTDTHTRTHAHTHTHRDTEGDTLLHCLLIHGEDMYHSGTGQEQSREIPFD